MSRKDISKYPKRNKSDILRVLSATDKTKKGKEWRGTGKSLLLHGSRSEEMTWEQSLKGIRWSFVKTCRKASV